MSGDAYGGINPHEDRGWGPHVDSSYDQNWGWPDESDGWRESSVGEEAEPVPEPQTDGAKGSVGERF